jgi:outer membrane protein OmpA-like peptidoglycan-associated protein
VRVVNATTNQVESTFKSKDDGSYSLILGSLNPYRIEFVHDPYIMTQAEFDFRTQEGYKEVKQDIELKSDYTLKFTVKDKDLGFGLTSFLSVTDNTGKKIYNDSLRVADLPLNLKLTTLNKYTAAVQAPNYVSKNQALTFDAAAFKPDAPYTVEMEPEKIKFAADVTDVNSKQKMRTKIYYNNESREEVIVAEEGEAVYLRKGDRYQVVTSSDKGYIFSSATVVAGEGTSDNGIYGIAMHVAPVKVGANLTLNHITFPSNSAELKPSSFLELDRVIDLLTNNPNISIEISAHTDDVGDDKYNNALSEKRAQSALQYLKNKKVSPQRLIAKGYGETRPVVSNDSEENRARNRRIELVIVRVD